MNAGSDHKEECWFDDLDQENRIEWCITLRTSDFETVGFSIGHQVSLAGEWVYVVRYIYEAGKLYLEEYSRESADPVNPRKEIAETEDIWIGWDLAHGRATERSSWESRTRRFLGKEEDN